MRSAVSKSGIMRRWPEKGEGMTTPKRAQRRSLKQIKTDLKPPPSGTPEGRVSTARWNSKGMRESTGP
jgi:hypothetical protein